MYYNMLLKGQQQQLPCRTQHSTSHSVFYNAAVVILQDVVAGAAAATTPRTADSTASSATTPVARRRGQRREESTTGTATANRRSCKGMNSYSNKRIGREDTVYRLKYKRYHNMQDGCHCKAGLVYMLKNKRYHNIHIGRLAPPHLLNTVQVSYTSGQSQQEKQTNVASIEEMRKRQK